jgi:hypothetical protein
VVLSLTICHCCNSASGKLTVIKGAIQDHTREELLGWFNEALVKMRQSSQRSLGQAWADRIKAELKESRHTLVLGEKDVLPTWSTQFKDVSGIQMLLNSGMTELMEAREKMIKQMEKLSHKPEQADVEVSSNHPSYYYRGFLAHICCHLCLVIKQLSSMST